nr:hypothetical protein [Tanacetum cinerariifolium]
KAASEEFKKYEDDKVEQRRAEMDALLDKLSADFDEELYLHMLTVIAGRRWVIRHGMRLVVMKCAESSSEIRQAFVDVVSAGLAKGMSEGLKYGIDHVSLCNPDLVNDPLQKKSHAIAYTNCHCKSCDRYGGCGRGIRILRETVHHREVAARLCQRRPALNNYRGGGAEDQVHDEVAYEIPLTGNASAMGVALETGLEKEVAAIGSPVNKMRHKRGNNVAEANAPPKGTATEILTKDAATIEVNIQFSVGSPESRRSSSVPSMVGSLGGIYQPGWGVTNDCLLDAPDAWQDIVDHIAPPRYFFELHHLPNANFLDQYNITLAWQVAMGSQLRLRILRETVHHREVAARLCQRRPALNNYRGGGAEDQVHDEVAYEIPLTGNASAMGVALETGLEKEVAAIGSPVNKMRHKRGNNVAEANAPPKVLRYGFVQLDQFPESHQGEAWDPSSILRETVHHREVAARLCQRRPALNNYRGGGAEDQVHDEVAYEIPLTGNASAMGVALETGLEKEVAAIGSPVNKMRHKRGNNVAEANAPPKVLRWDYDAFHPA